MTNKKEDLTEVNPKVSVKAGVLAGGAGLISSLKRKPEVKLKKDITDAEIDRFIKKLKPGDIITTGHYNPGTGKIYQILLNRNNQQYHTTVYVGKGLITELYPEDMKKPRKKNRFISH